MSTHCQRRNTQSNSRTMRQIFFHVNVHKFSIISGYRTRAKMETDKITLVHAVEIYRTIYTAPWFQGETVIGICFVNCIYNM